MLVLLLPAMPVAADLRPAFSLRLCAQRAADIAFVDTVSTEKGTFRVLEVWKGPLKKGAEIEVPPLSNLARGKMVLFLGGDKKKPGGTVFWEPAGFNMKTSVVWVKGDGLTAIQQPTNPGPAYETKLWYMPKQAQLKLAQLKAYVKKVAESGRLLQKAKQAKRAEDKVAACSGIINIKGAYVHHDEALKILAKCGRPAIATLTKYVNGRPVSHQRNRAIPALAEAGGRTVLPELAKMLADELAYWKKTAPTLKRGWWVHTTCEAWIRRERAGRLAHAFRKRPYAPAKPTLVELRDLFRATPAIEDDDRVSSVADDLDRAISAQLKKPNASTKRADKTPK